MKLNTILLYLIMLIKWLSPNLMSQLRQLNHVPPLQHSQVTLSLSLSLSLSLRFSSHSLSVFYFIF